MAFTTLCECEGNLDCHNPWTPQVDESEEEELSV